MDIDTTPVFGEEQVPKCVNISVDYVPGDLQVNINADNLVAKKTHVMLSEHK